MLIRAEMQAASMMLQSVGLAIRVFRIAIIERETRTERAFGEWIRDNNHD